MIVQPALHEALRTLTLSGMLDTLEARLPQARAGELGHIEFLQVLCHDEIARRDSQAVTRRIRRAQFEAQATLEGFDFTASPKLPAAQIRDLAALWSTTDADAGVGGGANIGEFTCAQSSWTSQITVNPLPSASARLIQR